MLAGTQWPAAGEAWAAAGGWVQVCPLIAILVNCWRLYALAGVEWSRREGAERPRRRETSPPGPFVCHLLPRSALPLPPLCRRGLVFRSARTASGRSALLGGRGGGLADGGVMGLAGLELGVLVEVHQAALVLKDVLAVGQLAAEYVVGVLDVAVGDDGLVEHELGGAVLHGEMALHAAVLAHGVGGAGEDVEGVALAVGAGALHALPQGQVLGAGHLHVVVDERPPPGSCR